jgi:hypothetical protein
MKFNFFKKYCGMVALVFVTTFTTFANANVITQDNFITGNPAAWTFQFNAFDPLLGTLTGVRFDWDITFKGMIDNDECSTSPNNCDGTRFLDLVFGGLSTGTKQYMLIWGIDQELNLQSGGMSTFIASFYNGWTDAQTLAITTGCDNYQQAATGCFNGTGGAVLTGMTTLTYTYTRAIPIPIPEPATLAIFALGLMGLASRRLMKKS